MFTHQIVQKFEEIAGDALRDGWDGLEGLHIEHYSWGDRFQQKFQDRIKTIIRLRYIQ